jgi:transposase-like protein
LSGSERIESWEGFPNFLVLPEDYRRAKEVAGMPLSDDLRERVVVAVVDGGMSRNAAAKRFGVSIASAARWVARFRSQRHDFGDLDDPVASSPSRLAARSHSPPAGHAAGNPRTPDRLSRWAFPVLRALAPFRSP